MRFGKRLAEVVERRNSDAASKCHSSSLLSGVEPYVSYKGLKHKLGLITRLQEEQFAAGVPLHHVGAEFDGGTSSSSSSYPASKWECEIKRHQVDFFELLDSDCAQAIHYVNCSVAVLEMAVGEWQAAAALAGLLYTPDQLDEIATLVPFQLDSREALVDWLHGLQRAAPNQTPKKSLLSKYNMVSVSVNILLQYIEVSLTAVRKILKKFEKKVAVGRVQNAESFKAHHELFALSVRQLLETAVQMQRIVVDDSEADEPPDDEQAEEPVLIAPLGPESVALLTRIPGASTTLTEIHVAPQFSCIDVYAKPGALTVCKTKTAAAGGGCSGPAAAAHPAPQPASGPASGKQPAPQGNATRDEAADGGAKGANASGRGGGGRGGRGGKSGGGRGGKGRGGGRQPAQGPGSYARGAGGLGRGGEGSVPSNDPSGRQPAQGHGSYGRGAGPSQQRPPGHSFAQHPPAAPTTMMGAWPPGGVGRGVGRFGYPVEGDGYGPVPMIAAWHPDWVMAMSPLVWPGMTPARPG